MAARTDPRCGTPSGYSRHRYLDEPACEACRRAHAGRIASHRAERGRRDQLLGKARTKAYQRLSHEFPARFRELYEQAKAEVFAASREVSGDG